MSLEKRGLILYEYCKLAYPEYKIQASIAWIEAGMSLKKTPAEKVKTKHQIPPEKWEVIYGEYKVICDFAFFRSMKIQNAVIGLDLKQKYREHSPYSKLKQIYNKYHLLR